jgi:acyl carrier protein phosphodiesterase
VNYLAHFYLSGDDTGLLLGNFVADSVKGKKYLEYAPEVQKGILMHRFIDHFTDTHPVTERTKQRLRPRFHHYAPVVVDVFFDHFLARNWNRFSSLPLDQYAEQVYEKLQMESVIFPDKSRHFLKYMRMYNWLCAYATVEGIGEVMQGMARRTPYKSGMENGAEALREHYEDYARDFDEFFPELEQACVIHKGQ